MAGVDEVLVLQEVTVTCPTEGCENYGIPIVVQVAIVNPRCVCGPCGTDLLGHA